MNTEPPGAHPWALELDRVSLSLGSLSVLQDVSLQVARGQFVALLGPNGGGKSSLIKVVLGLLTPSAGRVSVLGHPPAQARQRVGYVPQFATFARDFPITVAEAVLHGRLGLRPWWFPLGAPDREAAQQAMADTGVSDLAQRPIGSLSGGQLQRVLIARALATQPELLLLDEPTAHVDGRSETQLFDLLARLKPRVTVLMVSHDVGLVSRHVDSMACLNRRLVCHSDLPLAPGTLEALYGMPLQLVDHRHDTAPRHCQHEAAPS